jgi:hypothetical protein
LARVVTAAAEEGPGEDGRAGEGRAEEEEQEEEEEEEEEQEQGAVRALPIRMQCIPSTRHDGNTHRTRV